jgi:3-oxoacyl-(acyl-carrier-protein) synthase
LKIPVYINSIASVSPLGKTSEETWENYKNQKHFIKKHDFSGTEAFAAFLPKELKEELNELRISSPDLKNLDESVLFSVFVAREAVKNAGWGLGENIGVNIGSSRGATQLFEKYHQLFLDTKKAKILASPTTTLGNISSWVAQDLQSSGPEISHSVTCSTGLHAVLNGVAWLQAEMADKFLVGGSEAALTPFTIAQMKAMKIYASEDLDFPCRSVDMDKTRNSMVLGEGAGVLCISKNPENSIAQIGGIGYATEKLKHSVSISANGECFQKSMKMAIGNRNLDEIDAVVMHAPGTIKGDKAEVIAIKELFGENLPAMTSNKWKIGHTFGASGILSLQLAVLMLQQQEFVPIPFSKISTTPGKLRNILVNAVGFGGNAVSILVSKI